MNQFICSIKYPYTKYILQHHKLYEIRTKIPKDMKTGDRIFVVESGSHGQIPFHFLVGNIIEIEPKLAWQRYHLLLGIPIEDFKLYVDGKDKIYLIEITNLYNLYYCLSVSDFGFSRAPNWFYKWR